LHLNDDESVLSFLKRLLHKLQYHRQNFVSRQSSVEKELEMKIFWLLFFVLICLYIGLYQFLYSIKDDQRERFKGEILPLHYKYEFGGAFEELNLKSKDGGTINAVLFHATKPKGVICFWKGNGGTIKSWSGIVPFYQSLDYDIIIADYREQGKSRGWISLENFYSDAQMIYQFLKGSYDEKQIIVGGFSLGGLIAAHLASVNNPKLVFLIDPSSTTSDFSDRFFQKLYFPFPTLNEFDFAPNADMEKIKSPLIVLVTDNKNSPAHQLKGHLKSQDKFIEVSNSIHSTILYDKKTLDTIAGFLSHSVED
jgi:uncharacterized protein